VIGSQNFICVERKKTLQIQNKDLKDPEELDRLAFNGNNMESYWKTSCTPSDSHTSKSEFVTVVKDKFIGGVPFNNPIPRSQARHFLRIQLGRQGRSPSFTRIFWQP
jgi:hypothetical protein